MSNKLPHNIKRMELTKVWPEESKEASIDLTGSDVEEMIDSLKWGDKAVPLMHPYHEPVFLLVAYADEEPIVEAEIAAGFINDGSSWREVMNGKALALMERLISTVPPSDIEKPTEPCFA